MCNNITSWNETTALLLIHVITYQLSITCLVHEGPFFLYQFQILLFWISDTQFDSIQGCQQWQHLWNSEKPSGSYWKLLLWNWKWAQDQCPRQILMNSDWKSDFSCEWGPYALYGVDSHTWRVSKTCVQGRCLWLFLTSGWKVGSICATLCKAFSHL